MNHIYVSKWSQPTIIFSASDVCLVSSHICHGNIPYLTRGFTIHVANFQMFYILWGKEHIKRKTRVYQVKA